MGLAEVWRYGVMRSISEGSTSTQLWLRYCTWTEVQRYVTALLRTCESGNGMNYRSGQRCGTFIYLHRRHERGKIGAGAKLAKALVCLNVFCSDFPNSSSINLEESKDFHHHHQKLEWDKNVPTHLGSSKPRKQNACRESLR